jgi:hypothetical protein
VARRPAAPPPTRSTSCGPRVSSLTPELLVDQHPSSVVRDQVVQAAVVELLTVGLAATGEENVLGEETLLVLGHRPLPAALVTAWRGARVETG